MTAVNKLLTLYRKESRKSQKEVAEHVGISQSMLSKIEKGDALPVGYFYKLTRFLDVPVETEDAFLEAEYDDMEIAVAQNEKMSLKDKRILLAIYGHFIQRDSVWNMEAYLINQAENPEE